MLISLHFIVVWWWFVIANKSQLISLLVVLFLWHLHIVKYYIYIHTYTRQKHEITCQDGNPIVVIVENHESSVFTQLVITADAEPHSSF